MHAVHAVRVYVTGKVQGVHFRQTTRDTAGMYNVRGWVRNLPDGRVEAKFLGTEFAVAQMVAWCQTGPPGARVRHVDVMEATQDADDPGTFEVRR